MFNKYVYENRHSSVNARVDVTEKRAPTDESVRLLREMEAAAREQIVATTVVRDTVFECVIYMHHDLAAYEDIYRIVYSLNGRKLTIDVRVRRWDRPTEQQVVETIMAGLANDIAGQLLTSAFRNVKFD